jgi:hypothetical protein
MECSRIPENAPDGARFQKTNGDLDLVVAAVLTDTNHTFMIEQLMFVIREECAIWLWF